MSTLSLEARIDELAQSRRDYASEAYHFVFESLDHVGERPSPLRASHHITVHQLLDGLRDLALQQFGPLSRCVFESWGVYGTDDFGEIVFRLIENDLLNRSDTDHRADFHDVFSFREAFEESYTPKIQIRDTTV